MQFDETSHNRCHILHKKIIVSSWKAFSVPNYQAQPRFGVQIPNRNMNASFKNDDFQGHIK